MNMTVKLGYFLVFACFCYVTGCSNHATQTRFQYVELSSENIPRPDDVKGILFFSYRDINDADTDLFYALGEWPEVEKILGTGLTPQRYGGTAEDVLRVCRLYFDEIVRSQKVGFVQERDMYGALLLVTSAGCYYDRFDTDGVTIFCTTLVDNSRTLRKELEAVGVWQKHKQRTMDLDCLSGMTGE